MFLPRTSRSHAPLALPLAVLLVGLLAPVPSLGADAKGTVKTASGEPAAGAQVTIPALKKRATTDEDGRFVIPEVPDGKWVLQVSSPRYGDAIVTLTVKDGVAKELDVEVDLAVHHESVVVTAGELTTSGEAAHPVSKLEGQDLVVRSQPTLGETLAQEPGVTSTQFGPGASRPVIRGQGGDRIRILEDGLGSGDASSTSPDHAVAVDPSSAESIEVLRGPSTLLYGSNAIGGVVNVLDQRIPTYLPDKPITGTVDLRGGTVADERMGGLSLAGAAGPIAWHLGASKRDTEDVDIPGFAMSKHAREEAEEHEEEGGEHGEEEEHAEEEHAEELAFGTLPNSALESEAGTAGISWIGDGGFVGISFTGVDSLYGIPGGHHHEHGEEHGEHDEHEASSATQQDDEEHEEEAEAIRVDLKQRRLDLRGEVTRPFGFLRGLQVRFGTSDYEHRELEGDLVGTVFRNDYWELRVEAPHRRFGPVLGSFGIQGSRRDFSAVGEEAFVPRNETDSWAAFVVEQVELNDDLRLELGARFDHQDTQADGIPGSRTFGDVSASFGLVWELEGPYVLSASFGRSVKHPNGEELFSNGPHIATQTFEIGDPSLDSETSLGADLAFRRTKGPVSGELAIFYNQIDGYIFESFTGEEEDGLPVAVFTQRDARFTGAELHGDVEVWHQDPHHIVVEVSGDLVRAELRDSGESLPRIPPARFGLGVRYQGDRFWGLVEARRWNRQDRTAPLEEPTDGFTFLNAAVGYRLFLGRTVSDVILRGTNLTDEEGRNHASFLKEQVPLPGRDVSLSYRLTF